MVEIINLIKTFSDGYTTDDISYQWDSDDPLQLSNNLDLPRFVIVSDIILWHLTKWIKNRFNIEHYSSSYCNVKTNTGKAKEDTIQNDKSYFLGEYSCLSVDLVFKRQFSYYLITIYVPGCMLVIVSWVCLFHYLSDTRNNWQSQRAPQKIYQGHWTSRSFNQHTDLLQVNFWLDPKAVPARVALGVTTLLTMSTQVIITNIMVIKGQGWWWHVLEYLPQTSSINSALPPVAYTKAIDVWQVKLLG